MTGSTLCRGGYEAHMTFDKEHAAVIETYASTLNGWVYSVITGCPLLGQGTYCYLTGYDKADPKALLQKMTEIRIDLVGLGINTLRSKIEHIVFDSKTGVYDL